MRRSWKTGWSMRTAVVLCALVAAGCNSFPASGIDPTGERILAVPPSSTTSLSNERYIDEPLGKLPWDAAVVLLQPQETVASVGAEVVLVAGVGGQDGYLRTNRRLEWTIAPGSVGHFVAVGQGSFGDLLVGDFNRPRKVNNTFAIGSTSRTNTRLNRGTCSHDDDVLVLRGQSWISLTSPVEGTSSVAVVAPEVYGWENRTKTTVVHWVDAQWTFPTPAIDPAGTKHVFATTVTRQSSGLPCEGWRVRYEIVGGPPAGFSPDGARSIEVPTDAAGRACVEIVQEQPVHGTNKICIQVIRPAEVPGAGGQKLIVGSGTTMQTWSAADLAIRKTGPATASVGATLTYGIELTNQGDLSAKDVVVTDAVPDGITYLDSTPPAELIGNKLQWRLGELAARGQQRIEVRFRSEREGSVANCCEVTAAGGLKANDCSTTAVASSSLDVQISGPTEAVVGSQITFGVTVANRGQAAVKGLLIKDRFEPGLEHEMAEGLQSIERSLGDLAAGESRRIDVTFRVTKPGRLCHNVEVTGPAITRATAQSCVMASAAAAPGPAAPPPSEMEQPRPTVAPSLSVEKIGPEQRTLGEKARFTVDVTNTGDETLQNVKVIDRYDPALVPTLATDGYRIENGELAWTIDSLPVGKSTRLEVHCTCQSVASKACSRVRVVLPDGSQTEDEACVEIREKEKAPAPSTPEPAVPPPPSGDGLTLSAVGLRNPVAVGKELTYEVRVTNIGSTAYRQINVTATVPEGMVPNPLGTVGPKPVKFNIEGPLVRFDPVFEIKPGESLVYRIRVQAKQPGVRRFRVEMSTPAFPKPLVQEAKTEVF